MERYQRCNVVERLMSLAASRSLPAQSKEKIIQLLYRSTFVGGSTVLITRCGLLSWIKGEMELQAHKANPEQRQLLSSLAVRLYKSSDTKHIDDWCGGNAREVFAGLGVDSRLS